MNVTILGGNNEGKDSVQTITDTNILTLKKQVAAGTKIRIEQLTGNSRIDSILVTEKDKNEAVKKCDQLQ